MATDWLTFGQQVTTLTRHRGFHKPPDDEQLHVLPHYVLAADDELGSVTNQLDKISRGAVEVLDKYALELEQSVSSSVCFPSFY